MITERLPRDSSWTQIDTGLPPGYAVTSASRWVSGPILVLSALENAEYPDGDGTGPQWHLSISNLGKRPKPKHVRRALRAFGMAGAELDNHEPGVAEHYWLPVDPARRVDCQCKEDEDTIVEPDGKTWTNPKPESGEACRGCAYERTFGRPCPIHAEGAEGRDGR